MEYVLSSSQRFFLAMSLILAIPYFLWRFGKTEYYAPLVVVQIIAGIVLGPGILGAAFPHYYDFVFTPEIILLLNGIAWWAVTMFVWIAGIELDLLQAWKFRVESCATAGLALGTPFLFGCITAAVMLMHGGWIGPKALTWQFVAGVGMACAVTALPILILFMEKLHILRRPIGQRILRYASMDDVAIWGVLALILMDWDRIGAQTCFLILFVAAVYLFRKLMQNIEECDRWYAGLIWLAVCGFAADWSGLHFMVGAFLAGAATDSHWFDQKRMDQLRHHVLLVVMPVFFLSTGLRTKWSMGQETVALAAAALLVASVTGKLLGVHLAGKILNWRPGEAFIIGWLLQTKALIMIIFVNILLDKQLITNDTFTALLLMAVGSTMLTVPVVTPKLEQMKEVSFCSE